MLVGYKLCMYIMIPTLWFFEGKALPPPLLVAKKHPKSIQAPSHPTQNLLNYSKLNID